jgi:hypothetical protein
MAFSVERGPVAEPRGSHNFYTLSVIHQLHYCSRPTVQTMNNIRIIGTVAIV